MTNLYQRASHSGRPLCFLAALFLGSAVCGYAQRLYHVELESKTVHQKKMTAVRKSLYYTKGGDLNIRWSSGLDTYYSNSSPFGFTFIYYPATNEKMAIDPQMFNPRDELLYLVAEGGAEDLGMARSGFVLKSSMKDGEFIVRRYEPSKPGSVCAWVELVLGADYLPVYCAYHDRKDRVITKTYYSKYTTAGGVAFPTRVTEVSWLREKADSTVRLDLYSHFEVDVPDGMFNYHIPTDAVSVEMKEGLKAYKKSLK